MQHGRNGDPDQIRDLSDGDPAVVRPDGFHRPEDRGPDDYDRGERQVPQAKLDWRKHEIGDQIDGEREREGAGDLLAGDTVEDVSER